MSASPSLETLPVELIASILSYLDVSSLRACSEVSAHLRAIASDSLLNPWRAPILQALMRHDPHPLKTLAVLSCVPRSNWIDILCYASPDWLLLEATLPNLSEEDYQRAFVRRFLPSWTKVRKNGSWRGAFKKMLWSIHHRLNTNCTTSEAWSNFIIIHRTGVANSTSTLSRTLDPLAVLNGLKEQSDLSHLPTSVRLLVRLQDVRIIMFGTLNRSSSMLRNAAAEELVCPPGVRPPLPTPGPLSRLVALSDSEEFEEDEGVEDDDDNESIYPPLPVSPSRPNAPTRARSASSPIRPFTPSPSSPTRSFWRARSRDSASATDAAGPSNSNGRSFWRTRSRDGTSDGAGPSTNGNGVTGGGGLMPGTGFLSRMFSSPSTFDRDEDESAVHPTQTPTSDPSEEAVPVQSLPPKDRKTQSKRRRRPRESGQDGEENDDRDARSPLPVMHHPTPHPSHFLYPNYTPSPLDHQDGDEDGMASIVGLGVGSSDWRWWGTKYASAIYPGLGSGVDGEEDPGQERDVREGGAVREEEEKTWVGPIVLVAQLYPTYNASLAQSPHEPTNPFEFERQFLQSQGLVAGRWASFNWVDLWAIAPWLRESGRITKVVEGFGLGIE